MLRFPSQDRCGLKYSGIALLLIYGFCLEQCSATSAHQLYQNERDELGRRKGKCRQALSSLLTFNQPKVLTLMGGNHCSVKQCPTSSAHLIYGSIVLHWQVSLDFVKKQKRGGVTNKRCVTFLFSGIMVSSNSSNTIKPWNSLLQMTGVQGKDIYDSGSNSYTLLSL